MARKKRKLTNVAKSFDEWFASYILENHLTELPSDTLKMLRDIAYAAHFKGYISGAHNTEEVFRKIPDE